MSLPRNTFSFRITNTNNTKSSSSSSSFLTIILHHQHHSIKECTSSCQVEREQARSLIPLVQDHHRLLVSLLLCNAVANEALPIFLDSIVPSYIAVLLSVTMVLFFGEIIPSGSFPRSPLFQYFTSYNP